MKPPYTYFASRSRIVYGLQVGTALQESTLLYRLVIGGEFPSDAETRDFGRLSGAWAALRGAEAAMEFFRMPLDARRHETTLLEVASGKVVRSVILNPNEDDLRRAEAWRAGIAQEAAV